MWLFVYKLCKKLQYEDINFRNKRTKTAGRIPVSGLWRTDYDVLGDGKKALLFLLKISMTDEQHF